GCCTRDSSSSPHAVASRESTSCPLRPSATAMFKPPTLWANTVVPQASASSATRQNDSVIEGMATTSAARIYLASVSGATGGEKEHHCATPSKCALACKSYSEEPETAPVKCTTGKVWKPRSRRIARACNRTCGPLYRC